MNKVETTTESSVSSSVIVKANTAVASPTPEIDEFLNHLNVMQNSASIVRLFSHCSDETGAYVQLRPDYHYLPVLLDAKNSAVPLYHFVEVLDEVLNYDNVIEELPNLSYAQIGGALSFLRKVVQSNPNNIDIDKLEDEAVTSDPDFLQELRTALADQEVTRVLNRD